MPQAEDKRTVSQLLRQFDRLEAAKTRLVKAGLLNGDATPQMVVAKLRDIIPADLIA
jgi:hypothetical protein